MSHQSVCVRNNMTRNRIMYLAILLILFCNCVNQVTGFATRIDRPIKLKHCATTMQIHYRNHHISFTKLTASSDGENEVDDTDNFDGKGLANYLVPYALAFVASIAVTAGFIKFVLMDY